MESCTLVKSGRGLGGRHRRRDGAGRIARHPHQLAGHGAKRPLRAASCCSLAEWFPQTTGHRRSGGRVGTEIDVETVAVPRDLGGKYDLSLPFG